MTLQRANEAPSGAEPALPEQIDLSDSIVRATDRVEIRTIRYVLIEQRSMIGNVDLDYLDRAVRAGKRVVSDMIEKYGSEFVLPQVVHDCERTDIVDLVWSEDLCKRATGLNKLIKALADLDEFLENNENFAPKSPARTANLPFRAARREMRKGFRRVLGDLADRLFGEQKVG